MEGNDSSHNPLEKSDFPFIDGAEELADQNGDGVKATSHVKSPKPSRNDDAILSLLGKYSFPYLLASSIIQLSIYLNKLYEDSSAVGRYFNNFDLKCTLISVGSLVAPALIYICYVVAAYIKDQVKTESKEVGTRVVHGFLLVPWQIKGRVEVLQFSAQRICQRRELTDSELEEKCILERHAAVLEFFEEFYAGITQLLLQLYIIIKALDGHPDSEPLTGQIIASALTLMSMLVAVKRKDDGILNGTLSTLGWASIFISRSICIALSATVLYSWMALVLFLHAAGVSCWIYSIALPTYYKNSQRTDFTFKRKLALYILIFTVFGLPSVVYWPIMFELKKHRRPFGFFVILLMENALFISLWVVFKETPEWQRHCYILLYVIGGTFAAGVLFISLYAFCKPKYTDDVVYHDMKEGFQDTFGIYFEFCDVAFKLTRREKIENRLHEIREQRLLL